MAGEADKRIAKGEAGKLEGIPRVKDLFCTSSANYRMFKNPIFFYTKL